MNKKMLTKILGILAGMAAVLVVIAGLYNGVRTVAPDVNNALGALAGPDIASPYLSWGGVRDWATENAMNTGTTTVCSIQSPAATSTLSKASFTVSLASTTKESFDFSVNNPGSTASTTKRFGSDLTVQATQGGTYLASTTDSTITIFPPNYRLNIVMKGAYANGTGNTPVGVCTANWTQNAY